jgi:putative transposase
LTATLLTDLMMTPTPEPASQGGRDHRNPRPASIGIGGRLRSESPADFVGIRTLEDENGRLKKLLAEQMLDNAILKDVAAKKW